MGILFLIGPRGSGKSLAAKLLGRIYACRDYDTDQLVSQAEGRSISDIVAEEGWDAFRAMEKAALAKAVTMARADLGTPGVIATGGGIILAPENRALMRENGTVVYLSAPAEVLVGRLDQARQSSFRPPLSDLSFAKEIRFVVTERDPLYRDAAHHILDAVMKPEKLACQLHDIITRGETS